VVNGLKIENRAGGWIPPKIKKEFSSCKSDKNNKAMNITKQA